MSAENLASKLAETRDEIIAEATRTAVCTTA